MSTIPEPPRHRVSEGFVSPVPSCAQTGHHITYYSDGLKWEEFDFKDGKHHGPYIRYHPGDNTEPHIRCTYVDGVRDGVLTVGNPESKSFSEVVYRMGVIQSFKIVTEKTSIESIFTTDSEGTLESQTVYSPDGTVVGVGSYLNGSPVGVHRSEWVNPRFTKTIQEWEFTKGVVTAYREITHHKDGSRQETVTIPGLGALLKKVYWWYADGTLAEERDLGADGAVLRVVALRDKTGRDCILKDGEITVWKLAKAMVPAETLTKDVPTPTPAPVYPTRESSTVTKTTLAEITQVMKTPWVYIRLTVPADAKRVTPIDTDFAYKSRVEFAKVEEIIGEDGTQYTEAFSVVHSQGPTTTYRVGEIVRPNKFDPSPAVACTGGIHVHAYRDHCDVWKNAK